MKWVELKRDIDDNLINPPKDGQYIVKTQTMCGWNVLKVRLSTHTEKGKKKYHWTCKNQKVTHYLQENAD